MLELKNISYFYKSQKDKMPFLAQAAVVKRHFYRCLQD